MPINFPYQSKYGLKLDGVIQDGQKTTPNNMDLNGSEMIIATDDRTFETTKGNWADNGNHSATRDTTYKKTGTASLKIVATGAGDATTNYESLAADKFTTIVSENKFTKELWAYGDTVGVTLAMTIGDQTVTGKVVYSAVAGTFTKQVFNFLATGSTVTQPIQLYASNTGNIWVDDVSLTQAYDAMIVVLISKVFEVSIPRPIFKVQNVAIGTNPTVFNILYINNPGRLRTYLSDGTNSLNAVSSDNIPLNGLNYFIVVTYQRDGNISRYFNGSLTGSGTTSMVSVGKLSGLIALGIGAEIGLAPRFFKGGLGEIQFIRFTGLPSDIATTISAIYSRKKPLQSYTNGTIVAWYDWKRQGFDISGNNNHLTLVGNPPIVRI